MVVKAKPEEKLTMTAEATGVKKIAVTFNKAVDTTATKIVVKKGSATPTIASTTFASDAKSAEIVMGTKLTEGTYTVEATVGEEKFTADIAVKNETMTAFQLVSKNLVASPEGTTKATISYKAVNQYGEMMAPGKVQATCSFGTKVTWTTPTADKVGTVTVDEINTALAIVGTTGTLVLVDTTNGINLNETITYQSKAIASAATVEGVYSTKTEKLVEGNLKAGSKTDDYYILMNIQNQYGDDMSVEGIIASKSTVSFNPASVLTNLTIEEKDIHGADDKVVATTVGTNFKNINYNGKTCILVKLDATKVDTVTPVIPKGTISKAGTLNLTIVSANKGVLANPSFTVDDKVVISSFNVSAADTVFAGTDNKLIVDAVDVNGNAVTKYDDLNSAIKPQTSGSDSVVLKKNADGTGTFYYHPADLTGTYANKYKDTTIGTLIFNVNDNTSGNYMVKTVNVTVNANQEAWKVSGITADTITATAIGEDLVFDLSTLNYEDQYGNTIGYWDSKVKHDQIRYVVADQSEGVFATNSIDADKKKITISGASQKGSANLYLQYSSSDKDKESINEKNYDEVYDIKVPISVVDVSSVTASDLTVKINDGKTISGISEVTITPATASAIQTGPKATTAAAVVTAKVGGKNVVIPSDKVTVTSGTVGGYDDKRNTDKPIKTETKTVTLVVDSDNGPQILTADVVVSNDWAKATKIEKANDAKANATSSVVSASELAKTVKVTDQYGFTMTTTDKIVMTVTVTGANASKLSIAKNATQYVSIGKATDATITAGEKFTASVKYEFGGLTFTQDVTLQF